MTYGHFVFYDVDGTAAVQGTDGSYSINQSYLAHELVHVGQWETYGDAFVEHYVTNNGALEDEAYLVGP